MYLGRYQLGQSVPLRVLCRSSSQPPVDPANAPQYRVVSSSGVVATGQMPLLDPDQTGQLFQYLLFLNSTYSTGYYSVSYVYDAGNFEEVDLGDTFEVIPNGNVAGAVNSLAWYERPEAKFLIGRTDSGILYSGRNPSV